MWSERRRPTRSTTARARPNALPTFRIGDALSRCARRAVELLDPASRAAITAFVRSQLCADGGFHGRSAASDVYYTLFGLQCLDALGETEPTASMAYLAARPVAGLDLVHLSCVTRGRALLGVPPSEFADASMAALATHRSSSGAYRLDRTSSATSLYAGFLALLTAEACAAQLPDAAGLAAPLSACRATDGGYSDRPGISEATTTVTAAAIATLNSLDRAADTATSDWLLERYRTGGGFEACRMAPLPDLLSTATALFALCHSGVHIAHLAAPCFTFITGLWDASGGFAGYPLDPTPDCEYCYYALLSLGVLAEVL